MKKETRTIWEIEHYGDEQYVIGNLEASPKVKSVEVVSREYRFGCDECIEVVIEHSFETARELNEVLWDLCGE